MDAFRALQLVDWSQYGPEPCGEVVRRARRDWFNLGTPFLCGVPDGEAGAVEAREIIRNAQASAQWARVAEPRSGDVVLGGVYPGGETHHCGVWLDRGVVHWWQNVASGGGHVTVTAHSAFARLFQVVEFWRLRA